MDTASSWRHPVRVSTMRSISKKPPSTFWASDTPSVNMTMASRWPRRSRLTG